MDQLALLFALLLAAVLMVPVGDRLGLPPPVLMTLFGVLLALVPFVPAVDFPPDLILPLVLPPLLYAAAQRTSWRHFAAHLRPILLLAVALVFVTTAAVAVVAHAVVPGMPLLVAVVLGALVAPPDPVAATAVAGRVGLPRRLVSILEGEGLFNDVTAITLYHVAVAGVVTGSLSWAGAAGDLALAAVVAVAVGLALGWGACRVMRFLGDPILQTGLTLLVPFAAYVLSEELHGSGVLGVLAAALFLASDSAADADDVSGRLAGQTFWPVVDTLVTGVAFGLIGLELQTVLGAVRGRWSELLPAAALVVAAVVLVRLLWLLPAAWLARRMYRRRRDGERAAGAGEDLDEDVPGTWRETVIMWWSGMRGVASVALALAVPLTVEDGGPFPQRDAVLFVGFAVVLATLVLQGLTLPLLARLLGVRADTAAERELERRLALRSVKAARRRLAQIQEEEDLPEDVIEALGRRAYELGLRIAPELVETERSEEVAMRAERLHRMRRLHAELLSAARHEVLAARSEPGADPEVVDRVLHQLDVRSAPAPDRE